MEPNSNQEYFDAIIASLEAIEDAQTRIAIVAELEFLSKLGGVQPQPGWEESVNAAIKLRLNELLGVTT